MNLSELDRGARRRRDDDGYDGHRRERRRGSRSRSRGRDGGGRDGERESSGGRRRRKGWDDMGDTPVGAGLSLMLQQQQQFAAALTLPTGAPVQTSKKQRELYVGNLPTAMVSEAVLQVSEHR